MSKDVESFIRGEPPPPPLPRGNYQNLHDFLTPSGRGYESLPRSTIGRIKYTDPGNLSLLVSIGIHDHS